MSRNIKKPLICLAAIVAAGCANTPNPLEGYEEVQPAAVAEIPEPSTADFPAGQLERGRYMVTLLGCGNCHTNGALVGRPEPGKALAGSDVGIAWTNPLEDARPGVVFPANLTPDTETGLGHWSIEQIVTMLQSGVNNHGGRSLPVMPWQAYSRLMPEDAKAIAMYLKSLPPVRHEVPASVRPGQRTGHAYVHFGIYQSRQ